MKNRDRYVLKVNECDLLCILQVAFGSGLCSCVIEALTGKEYPCNLNLSADCCCQCIQKWLNSEE